jgi:flagellar hook protein FlgE
MASFSIPLTGLDADSTALNTIANNLSNMSTTAFKAQTTSFASLFSQQLGTTGSGNSIQQGAGVQVAANVTDFAQGSISSTDCTVDDMAINGSGFFVLSNGGTGAYEYTRGGDFITDSGGNLITQDGLNVMGYPATDGVINSNSALTPLVIPVGRVQAAQATANMSITADLNPAYSSSSSSSSSASPSPLSYAMKVYDSLGEVHTATVTLTQSATNTWAYSVALPASDFNSGTSTPITGTLNFDSTGVLQSVTNSLGVKTSVGTGATDTSSIPLSFTGLTDGAKDLGIKWDMLDASGTPTISQLQTGEASGVTGSSQDGYESGKYQSFNVGSDGTVIATFSNGEKENVGQVALANVANMQGLKAVGSDKYDTTLASGTAVVGTAGSQGLGAIQDSALEESNVNISSEFSKLIIAQRAFEADSKAVTTFDTVTQDTINMLH